MYIYILPIEWGNNQADMSNCLQWGDTGLINTPHCYISSESRQGPAQSDRWGDHNLEIIINFLSCSHSVNVNMTDLPRSAWPLLSQRAASWSGYPSWRSGDQPRLGGIITILEFTSWYINNTDLLHRLWINMKHQLNAVLNSLINQYFIILLLFSNLWFWFEWKK